MRKGLIILCTLGVVSAFLFYIFNFRPNSEKVFPDSTMPATSSPDGDSKWELVWEDNFEGSNLDLEHWTEVERKDNYNKELQYYSPQNSYVMDGCLYLTAKQEQKSGKKFTSAMVQTYGKFSFCYGKIEARIKLPKGKGLLPAFWLLTESGNNEIDVMEMIGSDPTVIYGVHHYTDRQKTKTDYQTIINNSTEEFHEYALEWNKDVLKCYLDGIQYFETDKGVPSEEMYIIFTLAVGGEWPGSPDKNTVFPCSMVIDHIRLYQYKWDGPIHDSD